MRKKKLLFLMITLLGCFYYSMQACYAVGNSKDNVLSIQIQPDNSASFKVTTYEGDKEVELKANSDGTYNYPEEFTIKTETKDKVEKWVVNGTDIKDFFNNNNQLPYITSSDIKQTLGLSNEEKLSGKVDVILYINKTEEYTVTFGLHTSSAPNSGNLKGEIEEGFFSNPINSGSTYEKGKTLTFKATPNVGYEVEDWYINDVKQSKNDNIFSITLERNTDVRVAFKRSEVKTVNIMINTFGAKEYSVFDISDNKEIEIKKTTFDKSCIVPLGHEIRFNATPFDGYSLTNCYYSIEGEKTTIDKLPFTIKIEKDALINVSFGSILYYGVKNDIGGTINATVNYYDNNDDDYDYDYYRLKSESSEIKSGQPFNPDEIDNFTFTATPNEGYRVKAWYKDGTLVKDMSGDDLTSNQYIYSFPSDHTTRVEVEFELISKKKLYTVTAAVNNEEYGHIKILNTETKEEIKSETQVEEGSILEFKLDLKKGCKLEYWVINGEKSTKYNSESIIITINNQAVSNNALDVKAILSSDITEPKPTFTATTSLEKGTEVGFTIEGAKEPFFIDWGDGNFEKYESSQYTKATIKGSNLRFSIESASSIRILDMGLTDIHFDQEMPNVESLNVNENKLIELRITNLPSLKYLMAENNKLTKLELTETVRKQLVQLYISDNQLQELPNGMNSLKRIVAVNNLLKSFDFRGSEMLEECEISHNYLNDIDLSNNKKLYKLFIEDNKLEQLNVQNNSDLLTLRVSDNQLSKIDISKCPSLTELYADNNKINEMSFANTKRLLQLRIRGNNLQASKLDSIFRVMPTRYGKEMNANLFISKNPGAETCSTIIAVNKNWTPDIEGTGTSIASIDKLNIRVKSSTSSWIIDEVPDNSTYEAYNFGGTCISKGMSKNGQIIVPKVEKPIILKIGTTIIKLI